MLSFSSFYKFSSVEMVTIIFYFLSIISSIYDKYKKKNEIDVYEKNQNIEIKDDKTYHLKQKSDFNSNIKNEIKKSFYEKVDGFELNESQIPLVSGFSNEINDECLVESFNDLKKEEIPEKVINESAYKHDILSEIGFKKEKEIQDPIEIVLKVDDITEFDITNAIDDVKAYNIEDDDKTINSERNIKNEPDIEDSIQNKFDTELEELDAIKTKIEENKEFIPINNTINTIDVEETKTIKVFLFSNDMLVKFEKNNTEIKEKEEQIEKYLSFTENILENLNANNEENNFELNVEGPVKNKNNQNNLENEIDEKKDKSFSNDESLEKNESAGDFEGINNNNHRSLDSNMLEKRKIEPDRKSLEIPGKIEKIYISNQINSYKSLIDESSNVIKDVSNINLSNNSEINETNLILTLNLKRMKEINVNSENKLLNEQEQKILINNNNDDYDDEITTFSEEIVYINDDLKKLFFNENLNTETYERNNYRANNMLDLTKMNSKTTKKLNYKEETYLCSLNRETSDTLDYRMGYPGLRDNYKLNDNLNFLTGKIQSRPKGDYIEKIHEKYWGNSNLLKQGFIQWLFPIKIQGANLDSHALQKHELEILKSKDNREIVIKNILKSYEMILDLYGLQVSLENGKIQKAKSFNEQFNFFVYNVHNNLQITRIMKCLGEFDLELFQLGFINFMLLEVFETKILEALGDGLTRYWIHTIKSDDERRSLIERAKYLITNN